MREREMAKQKITRKQAQLMETIERIKWCTVASLALSQGTTVGQLRQTLKALSRRDLVEWYFLRSGTEMVNVKPGWAERSRIVNFT